MAEAAQVIDLQQRRRTTRRMVRLTPNDALTNNTDGELHVREVNGNLLELLRPGHTYRTDVPREVYFDMPFDMNFNCYVNQPTEFPDDFVY